MYYDVLLAALPVFALVAEPTRPLERRRLAIALVVVVFLSAAYLNVLLLRNHFGASGPGRAALVLSGRLNVLLGLDELSYPPWEIFCLMALWVWCGWLWLMRTGPVLGKRSTGEAQAVP
jgi:hypothetical protein